MCWLVLILSANFSNNNVEQTKWICRITRSLYFTLSQIHLFPFLLTFYLITHILHVQEFYYCIIVLQNITKLGHKSQFKLGNTDKVISVEEILIDSACWFAAGPVEIASFDQFIWVFCCFVFKCLFLWIRLRAKYYLPNMLTVFVVSNQCVKNASKLFNQ